jgi:hypothetical protein
MPSKISYTAISVVSFLSLSSALCAQSVKEPTLIEILEQLEANLNRYDAAVPNFFCDEHALSARIEPNQRDENAITDSIFRLKRIHNHDHTTTLEESREIKSIDGKPTESQDVDFPTTLDGMFEGGLAVVTLSQAACMNYKLQRINKDHPAEPYIVSFATVLTPQNTEECFFKEESKGRVIIDPVSMQVARIEIKTPHHIVREGGSFGRTAMGKRELNIDYTPVPLGKQTFWMPSQITMRITSGSGFDTIVWKFQASYHNYHRLEVTSHILPDNDLHLH